ncbi:FMN-dependent NADH-azoreductase [Marinobacterium lutimaris]|uniref:FMN dependent NADH:quinone oxidoreductase n=1 Tax=Marinobacterium lutimaris TaxID=568106 RepID=A0A1H6CR78_9GAMM|nr:NAD(P)H-dependent oxidoreductase [Marinobacterium lutimaris]SEG75213.1 FMN-dependent NADH-azoreductase [Marinobacterium lutimaris]
MPELLYLTTSANAERSRSSLLCQRFIERFIGNRPGWNSLTRDLVSHPLPHLGPQQWDALRLDPEQLNIEQREYRALSDRLIREFDQASALVIALPLYNAGIPSQLKAYFDLLARAGVSFEFTADGPRGLLRDKDVYLVSTRGGILAPEDDHQIPAVEQLLNLVGITRIHKIIAEGLDLSPESADRGLSSAWQQLAALA